MRCDAKLGRIAARIYHAQRIVVLRQELERKTKVMGRDGANDSPDGQFVEFGRELC
jgi:hypothetical protein